ncbi:Aste57867_25001 [Aphanomyces stellatus]|uniref:Aste57867_25001 protein n=1 Tax=Aphanomyces stellatus TaxID=120398 RepID=A0A485LRZ5_9STRA|nr:hypothetical protein As57867_024923 [Aphanomyces stellatus]VFU01632.1 Aste57867_25001 [Aphanomyces stellatus]
MLRAALRCRRHFSHSPPTIFLHISPCGDWWTGGSMYAAKHLPSDYVKSLPLPVDFDESTLEDLPSLAFTRMYDSGMLDKALVVDGEHEPREN